MTKIIIETINGKMYTVIHHHKCEFFGLSPLIEMELGYIKGDEYKDGVFRAMMTALPALPRYPKPLDAKLLYAYAAHGIYTWMDDGDGRCGRFIGYGGAGKEGDVWDVRNKWTHGLRAGLTEITHALDDQGNRVDVAIEEGGV
jgi:hypothetical protein